MAWTLADKCGADDERNYCASPISATNTIVIGLDQGTTNAKAVALDPARQRRWPKRRGRSRPALPQSGVVEQDAEAMFANAVACIGEVDRRKRPLRQKSRHSALPTRPKLWSFGIARRASRHAGDGLAVTGAVPMRSHVCARRRHASGRAPASISIRPSPPRSSNGYFATGQRLPTGCATEDTVLRHGRYLADLEIDRRRDLCDRSEQCLAHHAVRYRAPRMGSRNSSRCSRLDLPSLPECRASNANFGRPMPAYSALQFRSPASWAISRLRFSAMAAFPKANSKSLMAPAHFSG